jgi:hypothetical protein
VPSGDGDEGDGLGVVTDLLDEVGGFLDNFVETVLTPLGGVHLVDGNDELTNTEGEGQKCVLASLAVLGDTSLELTSTTSDDEDSTIGLRGTSDHVLDEVTVAGGINDLNKGLLDLSIRKSVSALLTVTMYLGVSNFQRAISMVIPRSRSAFSLSRTQAVRDHELLIHAEFLGSRNAYHI